MGHDAILSSVVHSKEKSQHPPSSDILAPSKMAMCSSLHNVEVDYFLFEMGNGHILHTAFSTVGLVLVRTDSENNLFF
jgi:hypothetical protein